MKPAILLAPLVVASVTAAAPAAAATEPPLPYLKAALETYTGTGCPNKTVKALVNKDSTLVTLKFVQFYAESATTGETDTKSCDLRLSMTAPPGYQFASVQAAYTLFPTIMAGAHTSFDATYQFEGSAEPGGTFHQVYANPAESRVRHRLEDVAQPISSCGGTVTLVSHQEISATAGPRNAAAIIELESTDHGAEVGVSFTRC